MPKEVHRQIPPPPNTPELDILAEVLEGMQKFIDHPEQESSPAQPQTNDLQPIIDVPPTSKKDAE
jgi:hypothetical protein